MGTFHFGLPNILIYEMKNAEGKGGKYLEEEIISEGKEGKEGMKRGGKLLRTGWVDWNQGSIRT